VRKAKGRRLSPLASFSSTLLVSSIPGPRYSLLSFLVVQPIALSIAGSDSGGGAGIQADLKTFQRFGVFGTTAITAVTAQNTLGVTAWHAVEASLVRAQIDALIADLRPAAIKTGMLANASVIATVAACIKEHSLTTYVLDPVMVATSGDALMADDADTAIREVLVPLAMLVTPNLDEARILVGRDVQTVDAMKDAAEFLVRERGARSALVKGGHLPTGDAIDILYLDGQITAYSHPRLITRNTHGTGCTLSSAITAQLARGRPLRDAVGIALDYVHDAIRTAPGLGAGHGPLNHGARDLGPGARVPPGA
jgi:hydroxymethylpyrimidine/phosphomethylpyrimidine kinase